MLTTNPNTKPEVRDEVADYGEFVLTPGKIATCAVARSQASLSEANSFGQPNSSLVAARHISLGPGPVVRGSEGSAEAGRSPVEITYP